MDPKLRNFGGSLPVPNVQEVAKEPLKAVPPRYVRPDQDHPIVFDTVNYLSQVPIIDLQSILCGDDDVNSELQKLHLACKDWGFFQAAVLILGLVCLGGSLQRPFALFPGIEWLWLRLSFSIIVLFG
ncbi:hypothetical protein U1Q18_010156 [Sarracenia purpurea var. burkii]